jgi:hypothetical protein
MDIQTIGMTFPQNWDSVDLEEWFISLDKALGRTTANLSPEAGKGEK